MEKEIPGNITARKCRLFAWRVVFYALLLIDIGVLYWLHERFQLGKILAAMAIVCCYPTMLAAFRVRRNKHAVGHLERLQIRIKDVQAKAKQEGFQNQDKLWMN